MGNGSANDARNVVESTQRCAFTGSLWDRRKEEYGLAGETGGFIPAAMQRNRLGTAR